MLPELHGTDRGRDDRGSADRRSPIRPVFDEEQAFRERLADGWWTRHELMQFMGYGETWVWRRLERLKRGEYGQLARRPRKHAHYKPWEYHCFPVAVNVRTR